MRVKRSRKVRVDLFESRDDAMMAAAIPTPVMPGTGEPIFLEKATRRTRAARTPASRRWLSRCALLAFASITSNTHAGEPPVIFKETPIPEHALPRVDATFEIEAPPERIWPLVSDCNRFREFMDIESARVIERRGMRSRCQLVVDVPFPFGTLESISDNVAERSPGLLRLSWKLVRGDYVYDEGSWELTPAASGRRTLVRLSILSEPKLPVPNGMLKSGQRDFMKEMLLKLRRRVLAAR